MCKKHTDQRILWLYISKLSDTRPPLCFTPPPQELRPVLRHFYNTVHPLPGNEVRPEHSIGEPWRRPPRKRIRRAISKPPSPHIVTIIEDSEEEALEIIEDDIDSATGSQVLHRVQVSGCREWSFISRRHETYCWHGIPSVLGGSGKPRAISVRSAFKGFRARRHALVLTSIT